MPQFKVTIVEEFIKTIDAESADEAQLLVDSGYEIYDAEDLTDRQVEVEEVTNEG